GYSAVTEYAGYGDWDGATGTVHPPDSTISQSGGSGADRLQIHDGFGVTGRFGVFSHGWGGSGGMGGCSGIELLPVEDLRLEPIAHNEVRASFRLPAIPDGVRIANLYAHWITPETDDFALSAAKEAPGIPPICRDPDEIDCISAGPGDEVSVVVTQLF